MTTIDFDTDYRPEWPANMRSVVEPVFLARRAAGLSVQFVKPDGRRDEWQFTTAAHVAQKVAKLESLGWPYAVSK